MFSYVSCCHCCCCSEAARCVNVDNLPYCKTILTHTDSWPELATMYHTTKQKLMLMFKQQAEFPLVSPVFFRWVEVRCCPVHKSQLLSRSENRGRSGFSVLIKKCPLSILLLWKKSLLCEPYHSFSAKLQFFKIKYLNTYCLNILHFSFLNILQIMIK